MNQHQKSVFLETNSPLDGLQKIKKIIYTVVWENTNHFVSNT